GGRGTDTAPRLDPDPAACPRPGLRGDLPPRPVEPHEWGTPCRAPMPSAPTRCPTPGARSAPARPWPCACSGAARVGRRATGEPDQGCTVATERTEELPMARVIAFDVNETLLDLSDLDEPFE